MAEKQKKLVNTNKVKRYKQKNGYDNKQWITDQSKNADYKLKITEPGQAISVKKLVERYEKGQRATRIPSQLQ